MNMNIYIIKRMIFFHFKEKKNDIKDAKDVYDYLNNE